MPAATIYFRDPDSHLLEYPAMLGRTRDLMLAFVACLVAASRRGKLSNDRK